MEMMHLGSGDIAPRTLKLGTGWR